MAATSLDRCHAEFGKAFSAGDIDALCDMYEPDAIFVPGPGAQAIQGIAAIREALGGFLASKPRMEIETVFAHQNGDLALLRSRWKINGRGPDGSPVELAGSSTEVVRRQADGIWRYVIDHPFGAS